MNINEWINLLGLGLICGAVGQAVRVIAGMKKLGEEAGSMEKLREAFIPQQLIVSLLIGSAAGALAAIGLQIAIEILRKRVAEYAEKAVSFTFISFDRKTVHITPDGVSVK